MSSDQKCLSVSLNVGESRLIKELQGGHCKRFHWPLFVFDTFPLHPDTVCDTGNEPRNTVNWVICLTSL